MYIYLLSLLKGAPNTGNIISLWFICYGFEPWKQCYCKYVAGLNRGSSVIAKYGAGLNRGSSL